MNNADYDWVVRDPFEAFKPPRRVQPETQPAGWDAEAAIRAERARKQALNDAYLHDSRTARDIRTVKWLLRIAVVLLALLVLGGSAGAGFAASFWHAPVRVCESVISRC
jgi:hypothetical protein